MYWIYLEKLSKCEISASKFSVALEKCKPDILVIWQKKKKPKRLDFSVNL